MAPIKWRPSNGAPVPLVSGPSGRKKGEAFLELNECSNRCAPELQPVVAKTMVEVMDT